MIKQLIKIILFISIICQVNILISDFIKNNVYNKKNDVKTYIITKDNEIKSFPPLEIIEDLN